MIANTYIFADYFFDAQRMLALDPLKRISPLEALQHPFLVEDGLS